MTLEQTINCESASRSYGIVSLTNSIFGRQRWAKSHHFRTQNLHKLYEDLNITRKENTTKDLQQHRIQKNSKNVNSLFECIQNALNPFSDDIPKDKLFNIASGKSLNSEATEFLLI